MLDMSKYVAAKESVKITVCDKCKGEFVVSYEDLKVESITINGENLAVTNFRCPHCEKMYVVLIDTFHTLRAKENVQQELRKLEILKKRKDEYKIKKQIERIELKNKKLQRIYNMLEHKYTRYFI